ncbi:hypothetical protein SLE2022_044060 [Rubroshorea leprosula]
MFAHLSFYGVLGISSPHHLLLACLSRAPTMAVCSWRRPSILAIRSFLNFSPLIDNGILGEPSSLLDAGPMGKRNRPRLSGWTSPWLIEGFEKNPLCDRELGDELSPNRA